MRTELSDGTPVRIVFHHEEFPQPKAHVRQGNSRHNGEVVDIVAETTCWILRSDVPGRGRDKEKVMAEGRSRRSALDPPERAEDRRQRALRRAVEAFEREDRGRLLKAYFERRKGNGPGAVRA